MSLILINGEIVEVTGDEDVTVVRGGAGVPPETFGVDSGADGELCLFLFLSRNIVPVAKVRKFLIRFEEKNVVFVSAREHDPSKLD